MSGASLSGIVARVVYEDPESGFAVLRLEPDQGDDLVSVVGTLAGVRPKETVRLWGRFEDSPRFGRQFRADKWIPTGTNDARQVADYLASGAIPGVGPSLAERLLAHFRDDLPDVLAHQPERLTEVEGVGAVRARKIRGAWHAQDALRELMIFLQSHGISFGLARRIADRYGDQAVSVVRTNPYRLAVEVAGIGFLSADRIARQLGLAVDAPGRIEAALIHELGEASREGHVFTPREQLADDTAQRLDLPRTCVDPGIARLEAGGHVVEHPPDDTRAIYLMRWFTAETEAVHHAARLLEMPAPRSPAGHGTTRKFEARHGLTLSTEQREAITAAHEARLFVVTGGPGTGKTTLVRAVIETTHGSVLLAAPTGRAAKRMQEATGVHARTLHRLLEYDPKTRTFSRDHGRPLEADVVVIDEASMLDIELFAALVRAIPNGCRLVLVGDVDQLPSVGPGRVLGDLIQSGAPRVVRLRRIFRQSEASRIVTNAHLIHEGRMPELAASDGGPSDFYFVAQEDPNAALALLRRIVTERIPHRFGLDPAREVQVLAPMHRSSLGVAKLNEVLKSDLNPTPIPEGSRFSPGDKVMQTRNDYELGCFNGDVGFVQDVDPKRAALVVRFDDREVRFEGRQHEALTLAFACSVHKAQGSEYPAVVMPIDMQHFMMLHRNLLYTAVTRARRLMVIVGSRRALARAVHTVRDERRRTLLGQRLSARLKSAAR